MDLVKCRLWCQFEVDHNNNHKDQLYVCQKNKLGADLL